MHILFTHGTATLKIWLIAEDEDKQLSLREQSNFMLETEVVIYKGM